MPSSDHFLQVRQLGLVDYHTAWQAMQTFTANRSETTHDEIWLLQHPAVFTLGQAGKPEHVIAPGEIPVINVDRGGQVTYHGPGQLVAYTLLDLRRQKLGVRKLVTTLEKVLIALLAQYDIEAYAREDAPGVYVSGGAKIAQLGLRVRKGRSFHGLSLNVDMDLEPFQRINPCGYAESVVTSLAQQLNQPIDLAQLSKRLVSEFADQLAYNHVSYSTDMPLSA